MDNNTIQPKIIESIAQQSAPISAQTYSDADIALTMLQSSFQMELLGKQDREQIKWIYDFYDKKGVQDINEVLFDLQSIRTKIGNAPYGVSSLAHVYQYLKIVSQMGKLEEIKKGMEHATA